MNKYIAFHKGKFFMASPWVLDIQEKLPKNGKAWIYDTQRNEWFSRSYVNCLDVENRVPKAVRAALLLHL